MFQVKINVVAGWILNKKIKSKHTHTQTSTPLPQQKMPIQWATLKITNGPSFSKQVDSIIMTYVQEHLSNNDRVVNYLFKAVRDQVDELEGFISTIDEDARCVIFQKQSRRLRKLLQVRPEEYVKLLRKDGTLDAVANAQADDNNDPMYNIRGSITNAELGLGSPGGMMSRSIEKGGQITSVDMMDSGDRQFDLPLPPGVDLEVMADERSQLKNVRGSTKITYSPTKMKRKIYPWERGADTGEDVVGPATELIPPGGSFALKFVLTKKEFQHYKARLQIQEISRKYKNKAKGQGKDDMLLAGQPGSTIHRDFVNGRKKSAIETYSALRTGPYIEPSYNAERIYRSYEKDKWVSEKAFTTNI